jgi:PAS domain S-box-containing protein
MPSTALHLPGALKPDLSHALRLLGLSPSPRAAGEPSHRTILEDGPVAVVLADPDGLIRYASPAVLRETGQQPGALVGRHAIDLVHPDDRHDAETAIALVADAVRVRVALELRFAAANGEHRWVEAVMCPLRDARDDAVGWIVTAVRDLSQMHATTAEIADAAQRARTLADAADSGIALVMGDGEQIGTVLDANRAMGKDLGLTPDHLVGRSLMELVAATDHERLLAVLRCNATGSGPARLDVTSADHGGGARTSELTVAPLPGGAPDMPTRLIVGMRDVTDERALGEGLRQTVERLREANRELTGFARIAAHDIVGPAKVLAELAELLPVDTADPEQLEMLELVRTGVERVKAMVDGTLAYTRARERAPLRAPVDLGEVLDIVREGVDARGARVTNGELPTVSADARQLELLFANLISNALKHGGAELSRVHASAERDGPAWRISVADDGVGVSASDRERIFELFARAQSTPSTNGHGIGLATCRRIVESHGGRIWVEDNSSRGAVFHFTLPDGAAITTS